MSGLASSTGLSERAARLAARTLRAAVAEACGPDTDLAALWGGASDRPAHKLAPALDARSTSVFVVGEEDTASAMGHPDADMAVLGSPRIGLWFEIATSPLMPPPHSGVRHVGVGLVVHHLGSAVVGERVAVEARVIEREGRAVVFALTATVDGTLVASGVHHRRILDRSPG